MSHPKVVSIQGISGHKHVRGPGLMDGLMPYILCEVNCLLSCLSHMSGHFVNMHEQYDGGMRVSAVLTHRTCIRATYTVAGIDVARILEERNNAGKGRTF